MTGRRQLLVACAGLVLAACKEQPSAKAPAPAPASPRDAYEQASRGHGFSTGALMAANTAYVFFDPQCPHCAHLWNAAKPLHGKLKMVWMPVALLGASSAPQGATILTAPAPADAMEENESLVLQRKGGITANRSLPPDALDKVNANTELFKRLGADSVPYLVFKNAKSGEYGVHAGAMDTTQLAAVVGL
jgi:thiol:disulfide interchange protein DsbG